MGLSTSELTVRASRHLALCVAMALVFCGSSSCHFHSSSSGSSHDHSAHCDENHDEGEPCETEEAASADEEPAGTSGSIVVGSKPADFDLRSSRLGRHQALPRARNLAAALKPLDTLMPRAPVLLSVVVSDDFIVVNVSLGTSTHGSSPVADRPPHPAETTTHIELVVDRHGLLLASSSRVLRPAPRDLQGRR